MLLLVLVPERGFPFQKDPPRDHLSVRRFRRIRDDGPENTSYSREHVGTPFLNVRCQRCWRGRRGRITRRGVFVPFFVQATHADPVRIRFFTRRERKREVDNVTGSIDNVITKCVL